MWAAMTAGADPARTRRATQLLRRRFALGGALLALECPGVAQTAETMTMSSSAVSILMSADSGADGAIDLGGCTTEGWGAAADATREELPGAGTTRECADIGGTRSLCSTPALGADGCELLVHGNGCSCSTFCEHHGLRCAGSWEDVNEMCIKSAAKRECSDGFADGMQICLCEEVPPPPLFSDAVLTCFGVIGGILCLVLMAMCFCFAKTPECKIFTRKPEADVAQVAANKPKQRAQRMWKKGGAAAILATSVPVADRGRVRVLDLEAAPGGDMRHLDLFGDVTRKTTFLTPTPAQLKSSSFSGASSALSAPSEPGSPRRSRSSRSSSKSKRSSSSRSFRSSSGSGRDRSPSERGRSVERSRSSRSILFTDGDGSPRPPRSRRSPLHGRRSSRRLEDGP